MAQCPSCQQLIEIKEQNHGTLFTCPLCHAVFFVGWDGQPEHSSEAQVEGAPQVESFQPPALDIEQEQPSPFAIINEAESPGQVQESQDFMLESMPTENVEAPFSEAVEPSTASVQANYNFNDVTQFANSEVLSGPFSYTVTIKGIELAHIHEAVRDAVTDSRFGWDVTNIIGSIKNGELQIADLTPAKATILINRVKVLPVEVQWRQDVLAST